MVVSSIFRKIFTFPKLLGKVCVFDEHLFFFQTGGEENPSTTLQAEKVRCSIIMPECPMKVEGLPFCNLNVLCASSFVAYPRKESSQFAPENSMVGGMIRFLSVAPLRPYF